jgi:hypothetical protein
MSRRTVLIQGTKGLVVALPLVSSLLSATSVSAYTECVTCLRCYYAHGYCHDYDWIEVYDCYDCDTGAYCYSYEYIIPNAPGCGSSSC